MTDVAQMLVNLSAAYDPIMKMISGGAYTMGAAFAFMGIYQLKEYGEARTMMSSQTSLKAPLTYLIVAAVLVYLPTAVDILMMSSFGNTGSPLTYSTAGGSALVPADVTYAVLRLVQIVGLIAFIRGWVLLAQASKQGAQPALGKALTHIIGGILAINILGTKDVIGATFGVTFG